MEEKMIGSLGLPELWQSMSTMGVAQLVVLVLIIALFFTVFLIVVFRRSLTKWFNKKSDDSFSSYGWPTEEIIDIHKMPGKLSLMKNEAEEFQKKLLHKIEMLRKEQCTGKQFVINMEETVYMSDAVKKMFKDLADNSIKLNIVRLVYVVPKPNKIKNNNNAMDKFYVELDSICKRHNKPGSFSVKTGTRRKKFYET